MLARLEKEVGVTKAVVDRHGTLLRLHLLDDSAVGPVIERLLDLGFVGQIVPNETPSARWYGRNDVSELSAEEAGVIARRVVPRFAREHQLAANVADTVGGIVTAALRECFVTNVLDVGASAHSLDDSCGRAVYAATQAQLGDELAHSLGRDVEADLSGRRASTEEAMEKPKRSS